MPDPASAPPPRPALHAALSTDPAAMVAALLAEATLPAARNARIAAATADLITTVRRHPTGGGLEGFLGEYSLTTQEGVALMCIAEALLRVPDAATADDLLRDKLAGQDWARHLGHAPSLLVNASSWALMLAGRLLAPEERHDLGAVLHRMLARAGEPVIRTAMIQAIRQLGRQFVLGRTIADAITQARADERAGALHSYDMLGEAARTAADAARYTEAYAAAITAIGAANAGRGPIDGPGLSIKLSALHPRYEEMQGARVRRDLAARLHDLARLARDAGIGLTIDAEEADRLDLSLDLIEPLIADPALAGWAGLGLAVQAYQTRAPALIDHLGERAAAAGRRLIVRLVKGAYWDAEIKRAQERGLAAYPVHTRKVTTDVAYQLCAARLLAQPARFYPAFATHNARTLATVLELAAPGADFEIQRLHGMGASLHAAARDLLKDRDGRDLRRRIYAPVGGYEDLLAYLVRRLLENGANSSFVHQLTDPAVPVAQLSGDPVARLAGLRSKPHPGIPLPANLHQPQRSNAPGIDLADRAVRAALLAGIAEHTAGRFHAEPLIDGLAASGPRHDIRNPAARDHHPVGSWIAADAAALNRALATTCAAAPAWDATPLDTRAACLDALAERLVEDRDALLALLQAEAGKTLADAIAEWREAIDFCRYYAAQARLSLAPQTLAGPTGESNILTLHGRGVFLCISPWNFPLAIFLGQITAALVAGNAVIAKPAPQTPLIAARAVRHLLAAGIPAAALALLPGDGALGAALVADPRIAGVAFTGSVATAKAIQRTLAARPGAIVPLIAETGGQNAMIVDSTALPEQVVADALASGFGAAGQRCSALRVLCLQADIAAPVLTMLTGAMAELRVGDPADPPTDLGPVIDEAARDRLEAHIAAFAAHDRLIARGAAGPVGGYFVAPAVIAIDTLRDLPGEVFGPVIHVRIWQADALDALLDEIAATGFGLTLGVQSRRDGFVRHVAARLPVGNLYVNRGMTGAVVGVQPFGGMGLSGTGPKAGGPFYLPRFAGERVVSVNLAAAGGDARLLALDPDADDDPAP